MTTFWRAFAALTVALVLSMPCVAQAQQRAVPVVTAQVQQRDVPIYLDGLGSVIAAKTVTVRALVDGRPGKDVLEVLPVGGRACLCEGRLVCVEPRLRCLQLGGKPWSEGEDRALISVGGRTMLETVVGALDGSDLVEQLIDPIPSSAHERHLPHEAFTRSDPGCRSTWYSAGSATPA